jgi:hypothetical protein
MKIVITSPVEHDGKAIEIGDTPDLPKEPAEALIAAGAALKAGKSEPAAPPLAPAGA